jgi:hydroxyacylglutathione hydrolase
MAVGVVVSGVSVITVIYFLASFIYQKTMTRTGGGIKSLHMKIGYYLYSNTRVGQWVYRRELRKAHSRLNGRPHSDAESFKRNGLAIHPVPLSEDNYSYVVVDEPNETAILIDPADHETVQAFLFKNNIHPVAVLTTHKHWDHSASNSDWRRSYPGIEICGSALEHVPAVTRLVSDGDVLSFGRLCITAYHTPGHTAGHMVYLLDGSPFAADSSVFSGDLLFIGGAGRLFEGDAATMLRSLDCMCQLPDETLLWPGHEYTLTNLQFAASLEPNNIIVMNKLSKTIDRRLSRQATCPSTIGAEKLYNPFLRTQDDKLLAALQLKPTTTAANTFVSRSQLRIVALAECRARKDAFRPPRHKL